MAITKIQAGALPADVITTAAIDDASITHAKLHTTMDLSSKTVTLPSAITDTITNKLPLAGGTLTGTLNVTQASTADTIKLTRGTTAHNNMIKFVTGSTDKWIVGQRNDSTDHFRFYSYGTSSDVLSIQTDGKVGIGTTTPGENLEIHDATMSTLSLSYAGTAGNGSSIDSNLRPPTAIAAPLTSQILFSDDGAYRQNIYFKTKTSGTASSGLSTRMTISPDGNVGIGATIPTAKLHVEGTFQVRSSSSSIFNDTNNAENVRMLVSGTHFNADGADKDFRVESDGNSNMLFVDGGSNQVRIGTGSNVTFGDARLQVLGPSTGWNIGLNVAATSSTSGAIGISVASGSSARVLRVDKVGIGIVGTIDQSNSGVTYNTTSDRRLKDNIEPIADATDKLMSMKPVTHTWIAAPEADAVHGFIAQEMQEVIPEAVSGDAESDEMMSMDYGRITPVIVAALQDALKEIKELKTRIDELENN